MADRNTVAEIPVGARRDMLDVLRFAFERRKCAVDYALLLTMNPDQCRALAERFNELATPDAHISPKCVQALFTNPQHAHNLSRKGEIRIYIPKNSRRDGALALSKGTDSIVVSCRREYVNDNARGFHAGYSLNATAENDVDLVYSGELDDSRLNIATRHLDWVELKSEATRCGYREATRRARGTGSRHARSGRGEEVVQGM